MTIQAKRHIRFHTVLIYRFNQLPNLANEESDVAGGERLLRLRELLTFQSNELQANPRLAPRHRPPARHTVFPFVVRQPDGFTRSIHGYGENLAVRLVAIR